ncbi:MAG: Unannotated protein [Actinomycetota bacterium]|nr:Unannotated protein [Actinomycetota bacterium]
MKMHPHLHQSKETAASSSQGQAALPSWGARTRRCGRSAALGVVALVVAAGATVSTGSPAQAAGPENAAEWGVGQLAKNFAEGIVFEGGSEAFGLLFDLLAGPDPATAATAEALKEMKCQLTEIQGQLAAVESSISAVQSEIHLAESDTVMTDLSQMNTAVSAVYARNFLPIVDAAIALQEAKAKGADTAAAQSKLDQAKKEFRRNFVAARIAEIPTNQHKLLMPNSGFQSALKVAGKVMMDKGYVTERDSMLLRKLYLGLADQEAAATRLILEYDKMNGNDQLYAADVAAYTKNRADEEKNLPALIPSSVIIDTTSGSTLGSTAFNPIASDPDGSPILGNTNWLPINAEGVQLGTSKITAIVADHRGWHLPANAEMAKLNAALSRVPDATTVADRLRKVAPDTGIDGWHWTAALERPVVWTTDTSPSNPTECWTGYIEGGNSRVERYYYMHNAALLGGPTVSFEAHPGGLSPDLNGPYDTDSADPSTCDAYVSYQLMGQPINQAGIVLTQKNAVAYMAE